MPAIGAANRRPATVAAQTRRGRVGSLHLSPSWHRPPAVRELLNRDASKAAHGNGHGDGRSSSLVGVAAGRACEACRGRERHHDLRVIRGDRSCCPDRRGGFGRRICVQVERTVDAPIQCVWVVLRDYRAARPQMLTEPFADYAPALRRAARASQRLPRCQRNMIARPSTCCLHPGRARVQRLIAPEARRSRWSSPASRPRAGLQRTSRNHSVLAGRRWSHGCRRARLAAGLTSRPSGLEAARFRYEPADRLRPAR